MPRTSRLIDRTGLQVSLSPNGSAVLGLDESHSPFMNLLQYGTTLDADVMSDSEYLRIAHKVRLTCARLL